MRSNFRQEDIIARIGGDEFCVLLPNTSAAVAASIKQRLLINAGRRKTDKCALSLSIGYAVKQDPAESIDFTLIKADSAMYKHKEEQKAETQSPDLKFAPGSSHQKAETQNLS